MQPANGKQLSGRILSVRALMNQKPEFRIVMFSKKGWHWIALLATTLLLPANNAVAQQDSPKDLLGHIRALRQVSSWKMSYSYRHEVESELHLDNLHNESEAFLESSGEVIFRKAGTSGFEGSGSGKYDLRSRTKDWGTFWEGQTEDQFVENWSEGKGSDSFDREGTKLEFDWSDMTYSFTLVLGDGEGAPVRTGFNTNIEHPDARPMLEAIQKDSNAENPMSNMVKALARATEASLDYLQGPSVEDGFEKFSFGKAFIPIPVFGSVLSGSETDLYGGILTWRMEPLEPAERDDSELGGTEVWTHYHPPEEGKNFGYQTLWPPIIEEESKNFKASRTQSVEKTGLKVFLIQPGKVVAPSRRTTCGDSLVEYEISAGTLDFPGTENENGEKNAGYIRGNFSEQYPMDPESFPSRGGDVFRLYTPVNALFQLEENPGPGMVNPIARHLILLSDVTLEDGDAKISLEGIFEGDECEAERIRRQLEETAAQLEAVSEVDILLNSLPW